LRLNILLHIILRRALSDNSEQRILQKAQQWKADYLSEKTKLSTIRRSSFGDIAEAIALSLDQAEESFQKANSYEDKGDSVGAYQQYSAAVAQIQSAADLARVFDIVENGSESDLEAQLENAWGAASLKIDSLLTRLQGLDPQTASDAIALTQGYAGLSMAQGLLDYAETTLDQSSSLEELGEALVWVVMSPALVDAQITHADYLLDLSWGKQGAAIQVSQDQLEDFSQILKSAAEGNLAFLDSFLSEKLILSDYQYGFAWGTLKALDEFEKLTDQEKAYADLGSSLSSYYWSSRLIAKYYSLQAKINDNQIVEFERPRSLIFMLDSAEERAEEVIGLAERSGNDPILLMFSYESAKLARSGTPDDQMNALGELWYATLSGKLMAIFAGESLMDP
jgi:hypothetical protein